MALMRDALAMLNEDCHNCKLECLLQKYDELKEKYDALLKEQPEIVRCKDCKWFIKKFENEGRCIKHDNNYHEPDWFCADGTRKDS